MRQEADKRSASRLQLRDKRGASRPRRQTRRPGGSLKTRVMPVVMQDNPRADGSI